MWAMGDAQQEIMGDLENMASDGYANTLHSNRIFTICTCNFQSFTMK